MKKIILFLFFLAMMHLKLCSKPVGLENCGGTCFQNAAIQIAYQIDPLISLLSVRQDFYTRDTPEYIFQRLIWDIINAQKTNKSIIECGSADNPTNLKKLTEGIYECMNISIGDWGDLSEAFNILLQKLKKESDSNLFSILDMIQESTVHPPDIEPYTIRRYPPTIPFISLNNFAGPQNLKNYINNGLIKKKGSWLDPRTRIRHENVDLRDKLLFAPEFIIVAYATLGSFEHLKNTVFPDELNLTHYIKGNVPALYQLRAIGVHIPFGTGGHYFAVVRDRDEKLYVCNDQNISQVASWKEGIRTHNPAVFLYVLKTTKQDSSDSANLVNKLNNLQQSLKNLERALNNF
jgi:Ubiquitin carboxyl-terminal hydrolase